jgi:dolichol-phosphate mannosyltransferase
MKNNSSIKIVLPAYNEELGIGRLINKISDAMIDGLVDNYEIIIVNDGSSDKTGEIIKELSNIHPIFIHTHEVNQGLGATIRDGLQIASQRSSDRDIIITMDADDTHTPGLIPRLLRSIWPRVMMSYGASWLFQVFYPTKGVRDFTCGYRAYRSEVLKEAFTKYGDQFINQEGFQCMVDILLKLRKMNVLFGEVPFILRYDQKEGLSKMKVGSTVWNTVGLMWKRRFTLD